MKLYIFRRLLLSVLILLLVSILIFILMHVLPGDPLLAYVGANINGYSPEQITALRHEYQLDQPLINQYFNWLGGVLRGNLGESIIYQQNVSTMVAQKLLVTFNVAAAAFIISGILGVLFGVICAVKRGKWQDTLFTVLANLGITLPNFLIGILLIYLFSFKLNLLPTYGYTSPFTDLWMNIKMLIMPVFCLSVFALSAITRLTRSSMLEVIYQDYIRTAWAKGLRERVIILRHTIKNSLLPVVTSMGMQVSFMFGGAVLVETVFNIPGLGRMLVDGINTMDYQVVQGGVLVVAVLVVATNLLVDIIYGWLDPRIHYN